MLRRVKEDVLDLPPMREIILYSRKKSFRALIEILSCIFVAMTCIQKKIYKSILTKDLSIFESRRKTSLANGILYDICAEN